MKKQGFINDIKGIKEKKRNEKAKKLMTQFPELQKKVVLQTIEESPDLAHVVEQKKPVIQRDKSFKGRRQSIKIIDPVGQSRNHLCHSKSLSKETLSGTRQRESSKVITNNGIGEMVKPQKAKNIRKNKTLF